MLFWILAFLQILFGIAAGEATIRQTPEGAKTLSVLSKSGLFFLKWRAYASYKHELKGLRNIFGFMTLIFVALHFVIKPNETSSLLNLLPGLFLMLWLTMQFGVNLKKGIKEQFTIAGLFLIAPLFLWGLDYMTDYQFNLIRQFAIPFNTFDIQSFETYQIALILCILGGFAGTFMALFSILVLSIVPLFFLFLISISSIVSNRILKIEPNTAKNITYFYSFILGPILIILEGKGII